LLRAEGRIEKAESVIILGLTLSRDITFKNVRIAAQNNPFVEDHSQNIRRISWTEVPFIPTTQ